MSNPYEIWTFTYDANGMRTTRSDGNGGYTYIYNGDQLQEMRYGYDILYFSYDANGVPQTVSHNTTLNQYTTVYQYVTNQQGDVIGIQDYNGNVYASYSYNAWGEPISGHNASPGSIAFLNPLRYRGYVYDQETELYYVGSRYYDPEIGRFLNTDTVDILTATPMGLTDKNLFAYCDNNPVMRADHGGEFWNIVIGAAIGAVVNTVVSYAAAKMAGEEFSLVDAGIAFASGAITGAVAATGLGAIGQAVVGGAVGFGGSIANNVLENESISWESAAINGVAGFAGGLIGGNGIRKAGGKLDVAKKALEHADSLKKSGVKMVRNTVTKNLKKAAATYEEVYATESLITLGRFYAGAWGATVISKGGTRLLKY